MPVTTTLTDSEAEAAAHSQARKDAIFAGMASGLASAILGGSLLKFGRNKTIFCGTLTGALSGYFFFKGFLSSNLAQLRAERTRLVLNERRPDSTLPNHGS